MAELFEYGSKVYRRYPDSKKRSDRVYFKRSITGGTIWLHRQIWSDVHGEIPVGAHIHHADGNPLNNDISNLECLSPKEHIGGHEWPSERRASQNELLDRIRPLTKDWHASPQGIAKHRAIGAMAYEQFVPVAKKCEQCASEFLPKKIGSVDRFCSNKCKSAWRRASGVDNETRCCKQCGTPFVCNKYRDQKFCSGACSNSHRSRES